MFKNKVVNKPVLVKPWFDREFLKVRGEYFMIKNHRLWFPNKEAMSKCVKDMSIKYKAIIKDNKKSFHDRLHKSIPNFFFSKF